MTTTVEANDRSATGTGLDSPGTKAKPREFVQGLERGFAVIRAFSSEAPTLTIAQVADRTGLTRAVARRYLLTLQTLGYVMQEANRFSLTPRMLDLGFTYLSTLDVASVAPPFMERVTEALHESCSVCVLDGDEIVYVARRAAKRIMSINLALGSRLPAHATPMGKVMLAHLPPPELDAYFKAATLTRLTETTIVKPAELKKALAEVRVQGWAIADEETELGVRSIAAPIVDRAGEVHAALNVAGHAARVSLHQLKRTYLPVVLEAAHDISRALGAKLPAETRGAD
jgi:IclR family pca regulon transcriptional regulator